MNLQTLSFGHPVLLAFWWYCSGLAMGVLFWKFFLLNIGFEAATSSILGLVTAVFLAIGCTFSTQVRCTLLLIGFASFGRAGRIVLRTLLVSLILSGPISNLSHNSGEIIRVFACITSLTFNLTRNRFDLMTKPFQNAILGLHENVTSFKDNFHNLEDVYKAIVDEVEGEDNRTVKTRRSTEETPNFYEDRYRKKLKTRCQQQLAKGLEKCKDTFSDAFDQCYEKLPTVVNTLLCWPVQVSSICDFGDEVGFGSEDDSFCDPKGVVDEGFGQNYVALKRMESQFMGNFSDADLEFNFSANEDTIQAMESAQNITNAVLEDFKEKKNRFDRFAYIVDKIMVLSFLKVLIDGVKFHSNFINNIEFHNFYVTKYFQKIDRRRILAGKVHLLPLKRVERQNIVRLKGCKQLRKENRLKIFDSFRFLLELMTVTCFVVLDNLMSTMLKIVHDHSRIDYTQVGYHNVKVTVNGTGMIAYLTKSILNGFNTNIDFHSKLSNESCLPMPTVLNPTIIAKLYGCCVLILLMLCNGVYVERFKGHICARFYPQREKQRILFLYNQLLRRRLKLQQQVIESIRQKSKLRQQSNAFLQLRTRHPRLCGFVRLFDLGRFGCDICEEREPFPLSRCQPGVNLKECSCGFRYCEDCWRVIRAQCPACD